MRCTNLSGIPARSSATKPKPPLCRMRSVDFRTCSRRASWVLRGCFQLSAVGSGASYVVRRPFAKSKLSSSAGVPHPSAFFAEEPALRLSKGGVFDFAYDVRRTTYNGFSAHDVRPTTYDEARFPHRTQSSLLKSIPAAEP